MSAAKPAVVERLERAKAEREARSADAMKAELDTRMHGAESRREAIIDEIKTGAGEEVSKAKAIAAAHPKDAAAGAGAPAEAGAAAAEAGAAAAEAKESK